MTASSPTIAMLTDFGLDDCYVGAMKGVIRTIAPEACTVDLTHLVPRHSIIVGTAHLEQSAPYFPVGTIFLAVVDPGVGTERRALAAFSGGRYYVAPDNGLLSFVLAPDAQIHAIENRDLAFSPICPTFHGRDIFAPAAAHLARGVPLSEFGPPVDNPIRIPWPQPQPVETALWKLPILAVDHFGNLITALRAETPGKLGLHGISVRIGKNRIGSASPTFGAVQPGEWLAYWGSGGLLEIGINGGNAQAASGLGPGDCILLEDPMRRRSESKTGGPSS